MKTLLLIFALLPLAFLCLGTDQTKHLKTSVVSKTVAVSKTPTVSKMISSSNSGVVLTKADIPSFDEAKTLNRDFKSEQGSIYRILKINSYLTFEGGRECSRFTLTFARIKAARPGLVAIGFSSLCFGLSGSLNGGTLGYPDAKGHYQIDVYSSSLPPEIERLELAIQEITAPEFRQWANLTY